MSDGVWMIGQPAGLDEMRERVDAVFPTEEAAHAYIAERDDAWSFSREWGGEYRVVFVEYGEVPDDVFENAPVVKSPRRLEKEAERAREREELKVRNAEYAARYAATARVEFPKAHIDAFRQWAAENGVEIEEKP